MHLPNDIPFDVSYAARRGFHAKNAHPLPTHDSATASITPETLPKLQQQWTTMTTIKTVLITYALAISLDPNTLGQSREINPGLRIASWKFVQRVICVGTRGSIVEHKVRLGVSISRGDGGSCVCGRTVPIQAWTFVRRIIR
jgi:hypothetical protein